MNSLRHCLLCPRKCGVDRFPGSTGYCRSDASYSIASICRHFGEEPLISGKHGIVNLFFTHCNLQCVYCQNDQISDNSIDHQKNKMTLETIVSEIIRLLNEGSHAVGFVSASHVVPHVKTIIHALHEKNYYPLFVYNSNGYDCVETLRDLEGLIDVYLPDFKYSDADLAMEYSGAQDYPVKAILALQEMYRQKGPSVHVHDEKEVAISGMIIRHLVLPGHVENSKRALKTIAENLSPKVYISLMSQYYPTPRALSHPLLNRYVNKEEYDEVTKYIEELGFENGWLQEYESRDHYRPDFNKANPFRMT